MSSSPMSLLIIFMVVLIQGSKWVVHGEPKVPCFFIFGDSLVDNGNNNYLVTLARADFPPYGIDYPHGATGRFTNNRTIVDFFAELLGFGRHIPPFASAILNEDIVSGVNYASSAGGIREETARHLGDSFSFNRQLQNHRITVSRLTEKLGSTAAAADILNKCLYSVGFGSNDYIQNYFFPFTPTANLFTPQEFADALIDQYSSQIRTLYKLGAKKIVVHGLGQIGCIPYSIARFSDDYSSCVEKFNVAVQLFNDGLLSAIHGLRTNLTDADLIYINTSGMLSHITSIDFKETRKACCVTHIGGACLTGENPCKNRSEYFFYDEYHPTDAVNSVVASRSFTPSNPSDVYPYGITRLLP